MARAPGVAAVVNPGAGVGVPGGQPQGRTVPAPGGAVAALALVEGGQPPDTGADRGNCRAVPELLRT